MEDGQEQQRRDYRLLNEEPLDGRANPHSDPVLARLLSDWDTGTAVGGRCG
jgi:hypothetical protein